MLALCSSRPSPYARSVRGVGRRYRSPVPRNRFVAPNGGDRPARGSLVSPSTTDVIDPSRRARGGYRLRCASCPVGTTGRPHTGNSKGRTLGPPGPMSVRWHTRGPLRATTGGCMATTWTAHSRMWGRGPLRKGPVAAMFLRGAGRRRPLQTSHALLAGLEQIAGQTLTPAMSGINRNKRHALEVLPALPVVLALS